MPALESDVEPELACIACSKLLTPVVLGDRHVRACPANHGIWLEREDLVAVVDEDLDEPTQEEEDAAWRASEGNPRGMTTERFRSCPVCQRTLRKDIWKYGTGVVVDVCDEHGMWVDPGEIERIEAWTDAWHDHVG